MKYFFVALAALALMAAVPAHGQDAKAKEVIEKAQKKMSRLKTLKASFTLKVIGKDGRAMNTEKGSFLLKGDQYHITLPQQEIICDGKTVWTYLKDAAEVQVSNNNTSEQTLSPTKLFTNFYDKGYSYRYVASRKVAGKTCDVIELTPAKAGEFKRAELAFEKSGAIAGASVFDKNGNQYQYAVNAFTANPAIPETAFRFDAKAHPKAEVVDLR